MKKKPKGNRVEYVEPPPVPRVEVYPDHVVVVEMLTREEMARRFAPDEGNTND